MISRNSSTGVFFRAVYPNLEKRVGVSEDDILVGSYDDLYNKINLNILRINKIIIIKIIKKNNNKK